MIHLTPKFMGHNKPVATVTVETETTPERQNASKAIADSSDGNLSQDEVEFRRELEKRLPYSYDGATKSLLPNSPKKRQYFNAFYEEQYPLKLKRKEELDKQAAQLKDELRAANQRHEKYKGLERPVVSLTAVAAAAEVVLHTATLGATAVVPGAVTALGAAVGKALSPKSPRELKDELLDVQDEQEILENHLVNMEDERAMLLRERRQGKLPEGRSLQTGRPERKIHPLKKHRSRELDVQA